MSDEGVQINSTLRSSDIRWCLRRLPDRVQDVLEHFRTVYAIAGGFIRGNIAQGEHPSDVDVFAPSVGAAEELTERLSQTHEGVEHDVIETENAFTVLGYRLPIQMIHRWTYYRPVDAVRDFDWTIAQAGIWHNKHTGVWVSECADRFYEDLAAKRLYYTGCGEPGGSMLRLLKYYRMEYRIPLDSLGRLLAEMHGQVDWSDAPDGTKQTKRDWAGRIFTSLLQEVDPRAIIDDPDWLEGRANNE